MDGRWSRPASRACARPCACSAPGRSVWLAPARRCWQSKPGQHGLRRKSSARPARPTSAMSPGWASSLTRAARPQPLYLKPPDAKPQDARPPAAHLRLMRPWFGNAARPRSAASALGLANCAPASTRGVFPPALERGRIREPAWPAAMSSPTGWACRPASGGKIDAVRLHPVASGGRSRQKF